MFLPWLTAYCGPVMIAAENGKAAGNAETRLFHTITCRRVDESASLAQLSDHPKLPWGS